MPSRLGSRNPEAGKTHTLSTTANDPCLCGGFRIAVATGGEGNLEATYLQGDSVTLEFPVAGVYHEPGFFKEIWKPGAGAVGATTIIRYPK